MDNENQQIELLYFDDCPSWENAYTALSEALIDLGFQEEVKLIRVETQEEATKKNFTGSPMIKVNGEDIFPSGHENYALGCRLYQTPNGYKGWPTKDMFITQLDQFIKKDSQETK